MDSVGEGEGEVRGDSGVAVVDEVVEVARGGGDQVVRGDVARGVVDVLDHPAERGKIIEGDVEIEVEVDVGFGLAHQVENRLLDRPGGAAEQH